MTEEYATDRALLIAAAKRTCETDRIECLDALQDIWRLGDLFAQDHEYGDQLMAAQRRLIRAGHAQDASENVYRALLHSWCDGDLRGHNSGINVDGNESGFREIRVDPNSDIGELLRRIINGEM